jgi:chromosome segregation ATPase
MSTAGKVLVVLVLLTSLVWMILSAGVAQLNTNGNKRLHDLTEEVEKLQDELKQSQDEIAALKNEASFVQENIDREVALDRSHQSDVEKARSQIVESLERVRYQLAIVQDTIDRAKTALEHRNLEQQAEEQALAQAKSEVKELMDRSTELTNQLGSLRTEFQTTYRANIESLGKTR